MPEKIGFDILSSNGGVCPHAATRFVTIHGDRVQILEPEATRCLAYGWQGRGCNPVDCPNNVVINGGLH